MFGEEVNEARARVLDAAERLFMASGYAAVKLKHIAAALDMREASLYYHFPGGKETLFVAVMERTYARHQRGLRAAIAQAEGNWVEQLRAAARWLLSQPSLDIMRINKADLPAIAPAAARQLEDAAYEALNKPLFDVLAQANARGEANVPDPDLFAGIFIHMIGGIDIIKPEWNARTQAEMADMLITSWVNGLKPGEGFENLP